MSTYVTRTRQYNLRLGRPLTMSSIPRTDYLKVILLISLLTLCFYSALQKFVFTSTSNNLALVVDYSMCQKYDISGDRADPALLVGCKNAVNQGYSSAQKMCNGFIKQLSSCMHSKHPRCQNEHTNVDGCVNAIVKSAIEKWRSTD